MPLQILDQFPPAYSFLHIGTASTTVTVSSNPGILYSITINQKGAASSLISVYDNTAASGTLIGIIDPTQNVQTLLYEAAVTKGITVATTGAANTGDLTVTYAGKA